MADAVSKVSTPSSEDHNANPGKIFTHFVYKAALVTVFLLLLPLFPSLAPDFLNQTLHARSWELLQLIFVGIAVSYGLFSKKNDDEIKDKDHNSKVDNPTSYVSKLLQVSSVFDDESDDQSHVIEENKFQALNSQYYRGKPVVVVAEQSSLAEGENGVVSQIRQKPLLLPVRSLKQRVPITPNDLDSECSRRFNTKSIIGDLDVPKLEENVEETMVLRSPIPWRSRSGRMEVKENCDGDVGGASSLMEEQESNRLEKARSFKSSGPKKLSSSTSFSSETQSKTNEEVVRKKVFSPPPVPPPPPPPPPMPTLQLLRKPVLAKSNSTVANNADSPEKVFRRSARSVPETEIDELRRRMNSGFGPERIENDGLVKSVRTFRPSELGIRVEKDETKNELLEKVLMETTDEEEEESKDDQFDEGTINGEVASDNDVGRDVDKKADEFIAKFREQIRLQRIESIRRTTAQRAGKDLR